MSELIQDLRFGIRTLFKSPGFAVVAVTTLAIGIGANAAIFSYVDGILLRPSPYADVARMVRVLEKPPGGGRNGISTLNYLDWEKQNTVFEHMTAQLWGPATLTGLENPEQVYSEKVSVHFFDVFKDAPALGRVFAPGEDQVGRDHVAVISHKFWISRYGGDPGVLGRTISLDGELYTVIGVMPARIFDRTETKIWRPLAFGPENMTRDFHWFGAWALLKPGVTLEQARTQMDALAARIAQDYPKSNKGWGVGIDPFSEVLVNPALRRSLYVLMGAVGMVLLIACANLANLSLARGMAREREVAIRAALGAGRWRLMRQFLTESVVLSLFGGALGLLVAYAGLKALKVGIPPGILPPNVYVAMDARVLLFVLGVSVLTGVIFGVFPAIKATRPDQATVIKQGGHGASASRARQRLRGAVVVAEVALAFMLLTGAGLLIRSFFKMQAVETGFDSTNVITAYLPISGRRFHSADEFRIYLRRIAERTREIPGVRDVALTSALPMQGWGYGMPFQIVGATAVDPANRPACFFKMVGSSYFRTLGIRLTRGRFLDEHDVKGALPATVINETMAKKYFPNENPIGKRILVEEIAFAKTALGPEIPWEVVGVIADEKVGGLGSNNDYSPGMYVTHDQSPQTGQALVVRGTMAPGSIQRLIPKAIHEVDPDQVVQDLETLEQIKSESVGADRFYTILLTIFAGVALALSAIGLYGVISYSVVRRTREIGIRAALGASAADILGLILRSGMSLTAIGLVMGIAGAFGLTRFLSSMLFGIGSNDPVTLSVVAVALALIALLACYIPARRAMKVNPIVALRCD
jgi:putative ABC transport system permease protein